MRKSKYKAQEITEIEEAKRRETRSTGLKLMGTRDSGRDRLSNGVVVRWHTDNPPSYTVITDTHGDIEVTENTIPEGMLMLGDVLYDAEELRKALRWA